jgi:hypothetical protein
MSAVTHISFEELAGNLADLLTKVREEHTTLVVEYATGENVLIKPFSPPRLSTPKESEDVTPVAERTPQPQANQLPDKENISSTGAVYDLDPDSLTPG